MPSETHRQRIQRIIGSVFGGDTLKARVFRGGAWLGSGSFLEQTTRFGRNMLLTRLLAPEAFGTMAIVMAATSVLTSLLDVGAREALIQSARGTEKGHVGAAWWLSLVRSSSLYFLLFLVAPLASRFYGNVELTILLRVAGVGLLLEGAISARAYVAIKEMRFQKWAAINHGGGIAGVLITMILSFFIRDVWALVLGFVAEYVCRCLLSYVLCPFLPPLRWDRAAIRELLGFSRGVFGLAILNLIFIRTDIFVLAKLYSPAQLGLYAMAIYMVQTPTGFLINLLGQTMMPTFSHIQDDKPRMNRILLKVTAAIFLLGMPALVFLFFCGRSLLTLIYGYRYGTAAGALFVASCASLLNAANAQITTVFYAQGLPQLHRRCVAIMAILMIVLIYPFAKWFGLVGGQLACLISIVIGYVFQIERIRKLTGLDLSQYRKGFVVSGAISLTVVVVCVGGGRMLGNWAGPVPNIFVGIVGCVIAYALAFAIAFGTSRDNAESALGL